MFIGGKVRWHRWTVTSGKPQIARTLAHPVRLRILDILARQEACVCHLTAILQRPQPYVSQQLAGLPGAIVSTLAVAYGRALTWGSSQELALTVSLAIFAIVVWANGLGSLLPLLATRLKTDPAVVSGSVMSTLVGVTGLFIYFTVARLILGL